MSGARSFPARNAYQNPLPDRTATGFAPAPALSQGQFAQSGPSYGRQQYASHAQYAPPRMGQRAEPVPTAVTQLTQEQVDEIQEAFNLFDLDKDQNLDYHEFRVALQALGFKPPKTHILELLRMDGVPNQRLQDPAFQSRGLPGQPKQQLHPSQYLMPNATFTRIAAEMTLSRDPREEVERAFDLFDMDKKGMIDINDLKRVAMELGEANLEEQEFLTMIEEFDYDDVGGISKQTFMQICLQ